MPPRRSATIEDVAHLAGVSRMTVSRVLSHPQLVRPGTAQRVRQAIDQLHYVPNLSARDLVVRSSDLVGIIVSSVEVWLFVDTYRGLVDSLATQGLQVMLAEAGYTHDREEAILRTFIARRPAGIVLMGTHHSPVVVDMLRQARIPVVETWDLADQPIDRVIGFSNEESGAQVARHLVEQGCRQLALVTNDFPRNRKRANGFRRALKELDQPEPFEVRMPSLALRDVIGYGRSALRATLELSPDVDGLFFMSDNPAIGAMLEAQRLGIKVPERLAIVGHGDIPMAAQLGLSLSSIAVPGYAMGYLAGLSILHDAGHDITTIPLPEGVPPLADPHRMDLGSRLQARESTLRLRPSA